MSLKNTVLTICPKCHKTKPFMKIEGEEELLKMEEELTKIEEEEYKPTIPFSIIVLISTLLLICAIVYWKRETV